MSHQLKDPWQERYNDTLHAILTRLGGRKSRCTAEKACAFYRFFFQPPKTYLIRTFRRSIFLSRPFWRTPEAEFNTVHGSVPRKILKFWLLTGLTLSNWFWVLCACYLGLKQPWFKFRCGLPWERVLGWLPCYSHAGDSSERFGLHRSQCCVHAVEKVYCWIRSRNQCCVHAIFDSTKTSRWEQRSSMVKPLYKCTRHVRRWVRHSCRHSHVHILQSLIYKLRKQKKNTSFFKNN